MENRSIPRGPEIKVPSLRGLDRFFWFESDETTTLSSSLRARTPRNGHIEIIWLRLAYKRLTGYVWDDHNKKNRQIQGTLIRV